MVFVDVVDVVVAVVVVDVVVFVVVVWVIIIMQVLMIIMHVMMVVAFTVFESSPLASEHRPFPHPRLARVDALAGSCSSLLLLYITGPMHGALGTLGQCFQNMIMLLLLGDFINSPKNTVIYGPSFKLKNDFHDGYSNNSSKNCFMCIQDR